MRRIALCLVALLPLANVSCAVADDEGPTAEAAQSELDPGTKNWLTYSIQQNGAQVAQVLVTGSIAGAGYDADREYWYMTGNVSNKYPLTLIGGDSYTWATTPPALGALSFTMARRPVWTPGTPAGRMLVSTPLVGTPEKVAIQWSMYQVGGAWTGSISWWHTTTGNVFGPNQTFTASPQLVPAGTWYSYYSAPL